MVEMNLTQTLVLVLVLISVLVISYALIRKRKEKTKKSKEEDMAAGLQVFNSAGRVVFDSSANKRYGRIIGSVSVSDNGKGSRSVPAFSQGTPFYLTSVIGGVPNANSLPYVVKVNISGTTISWEAVRAATIYYGVY